MQALRYLQLDEKEGEIPYYAFQYKGFTNSDLKLRPKRYVSGFSMKRTSN